MYFFVEFHSRNSSSFNLRATNLMACMKVIWRFRHDRKDGQSCSLPITIRNLWGNGLAVGKTWVILDSTEILSWLTIQNFLYRYLLFNKMISHKIERLTTIQRMVLFYIKGWNTTFDTHTCFQTSSRIVSFSGLYLDMDESLNLSTIVNITYFIFNAQKLKLPIL